MSTLVILSHTEIGDCINHTPIIRYLSKKYEHVIFVLKDAPSIRKNVPLLLEDCPNVTFDYVTVTQPHHYFNIVDFAAHMQKYSADSSCKVRYGGHFKKLAGGSMILDTIPYMFYYDLRVPPAVFWRYMKIPRTLESAQLYETVRNQPYYFISPNSSTGSAFSVAQATALFKIDANETLIINSDYNIYSAGHKFYEVAQRFVMQRVIDYVDTLAHAAGILLSDSCMFCLALHVEIPAGVPCYFTTRYFNYADYIYAPEYGYVDSPLRAKFMLSPPL